MAEEPRIQSLPFGSWPSPLSAAQVSAGGVRLDGPAVRADADGRTEVWWCESRPAEGGRAVLVRRTADGSTADVLGAPWSARTRVHEYGGAAWFLGRRNAYFSHDDDQRVHRISGADLDSGDGEGPVPVPLTPEPPQRHALRYADGRESADGAWLVLVREDHTGRGEAVNEIVVVATDGSSVEGEGPRVIVSGTDFVAAPRISPDGRWLSWLRWNHPNMPWDGTELCAAPLFDGFRLGNTHVVAGSVTEAVIAPDWLADGRLVFATDRSGWWNLHTWSPGNGDDEVLTHLTESEIGHPPWVFGMQPWVEVGSGRLVAVETRKGIDRLVAVGDSGSIEAFDTPFVAVSGLAAAPNGDLLALAQTGTDLQAIVELAPGHRLDLRPPDDLGIDPAWYSRAESFEFVSSGGRTAHAFFHPPTAPAMRGTDGELPPLVVVGHGGPTAHSAPVLDLKIQYWTSRGFAVANVNYGGSSGHGRAYRRLLDRAWGVVDVEDCVAAARALAEAGRVDGSRMAIRGGSAGGFTVLAALTRHDVFAAGTSLYGIGDLAALAADTHKFESRYCDGLIGPYPEAADVYRERSPLTHTDGFSCPLLVLQGTEDEVVPPNQAEAIVAALAAKGLPHAVIYFEGEQHGFRRAETIVRSLEAELWFYGRVFGFVPADDIAPIDDAVGL